MADQYLNKDGLKTLWAKIKALISGKQDKLTSGTNIKTINNQSILGSGNISTTSGNSALTRVATYTGKVVFYARPSGNTTSERIFSTFSLNRTYIVIPYSMPWFNLTYGTTNEWPSMCFLQRTGNYTFMFRFFRNGMPMEYHDVDVRNQIVVFNSCIVCIVNI